MGFAASQARFLSLTARLSDNEYEAGQIAQERLGLTEQMALYADEFEQATTNRQMKIQLYYSGPAENTNAPISQTQNLTYENLMSGTWTNVAPESSGVRVPGDIPEYTTNSFYRLKSGDGAIVVSDKSEIPAGSAQKLGNRYIVSVPVKIDGKTVTEKQIYVVDEALKDNSQESPNYLQDCLREGKYLLEKGMKNTEKDEFEWHNVSLDETTNITDNYYTDDDSEALKKFNQAMAEISAKKLSQKIQYYSYSYENDPSGTYLNL